jgi:hypothetical protein
MVPLVSPVRVIGFDELVVHETPASIEYSTLVIVEPLFFATVKV